MTTAETLELVPTKELLEEFAKRYDSVIIAGHSKANHDTVVATTRINWKGDANQCLALAQRVAWQINQFLENQPELEHDDS